MESGKISQKRVELIKRASEIGILTGGLSTLHHKILSGSWEDKEIDCHGKTHPSIERRVEELDLELNENSRGV
ncbi:hypothetical protein AKJ52_00895 [candidate division MSBL1 archaeon SCGC-AAA382C18]|uniref:Uncharacterized protein n=1 Tax=candidate division MSBL1 archaeon SCGC-AAA382C18 TaxID=1698281 RepID=A0A133VKZ8_9EURY|nr:hypothetical protein AKJ52_00895 [candidate division MSBL1 archaeon SCGC-AAA382C18]